MLRMIRSYIYNKIIFPLTKLCYQEVLSRLPEGSHLLDVGIGTGKALCGNQSIIVKNNLKITGIDIDTAYLKSCQKLIIENQLQNFIILKELSFYDEQKTGYDAIYFSSSFMLLPDQRAALLKAKELLSPNGKIYFTQILHSKKNRFIEIIKPKLIYLTSIDFGKITYEKDFFQLIADANLQVIEYKSIKCWTKSWKEQLIIVA